MLKKKTLVFILIAGMLLSVVTGCADTSHGNKTGTGVRFSAKDIVQLSDKQLYKGKVALITDSPADIEVCSGLKKDLSGKGFTVDLLNYSQFLQIPNDSLADYKALLLTGKPSFPNSIRSSLAFYTQAGGKLILLNLLGSSSATVKNLSINPYQNILQENLSFGGKYQIGSAFSQIKNLGVDFPNQSVIIPILKGADDDDVNAAATLFVNYDGKYKNSDWLVFTVAQQKFYQTSQFNELCGRLIGLMINDTKVVSRAQQILPYFSDMTNAMFKMWGGGVYTVGGSDVFSSNQNFKSVGVFGSYGHDTTVDRNQNEGLLTTNVKYDTDDLTLYWPNFYGGGNDYTLGGLSVPGTVSSKKFVLDDWVTAHIDYTYCNGSAQTSARAYILRDYPAVVYTTDSREITWKMGTLTFDHLEYCGASGAKTVALGNQSQSINLSDMSRPWILAWNASSGSDIVPVLFRMQKKPESIEYTVESSIDFIFASSAGTVSILQPYGLQRITGTERKAWKNSAPSEAISIASFWSQCLAAYPVQNKETYQVHNSSMSTSVTDTYQYHVIRDDWGTKPVYIAPVSPTVVMAKDSGYPVTLNEPALKKCSIATYYGAFAYFVGTSSGYTIPIPSARDQMLTPMKVINDPGVSQYKSQLVDYLHQNPISNDPVNMAVKTYTQLLPTLDAKEQQSMSKPLSNAFAQMFSQKNLWTIVEPDFGQTYVMSNKIWCAGQNYDREWYNGRFLDIAWQYMNWIDAGTVKKYWNAIKGLDAYSRIYFDWAWSGVCSGTEGEASCGDGLNFALEGMLATARMAKVMGDNALCDNATYRASKQALSSFAAFYMAKWAARIDYALDTGKYPFKRLQPSQIVTGFAIDTYRSDGGLAVFRPGSYWDATGAIYDNNESEIRLYDESLFSTIYQWEYVVIPKMFPQWNTLTGHNAYDNVNYSSNLKATHITTRQIMFGEPLQNLADYVKNSDFKNNQEEYPRVLQTLVQADAPQVWAPVNTVKVCSNTWDAAAKQLETVVTGTAGGASDYQWAWRQFSSGDKAEPGPSAKSITVNGSKISSCQVKGGFWQITFTAAKNKKYDIKICY